MFGRKDTGFANFPYADFQDLNLDWMLKKLKEYDEEIKLLKTAIKEIKEELESM